MTIPSNKLNRHGKAIKLHAQNQNLASFYMEVHAYSGRIKDSRYCLMHYSAPGNHVKKMQHTEI